MTTESASYAARLDVDHPEQLDRVSSFFRLLWAIPILVIYNVLTATSRDTVELIDEAGNVIQTATYTSGGVIGGLFVATALMIVFRVKYPRWWFDFTRELARFSARVGAYLALLTDNYPSTTDEQSVHLELDYPNVERDLNRWMPLVKWLLALPHYIVLAFLLLGVVVAVVVAWFAILFTGRYPRALFDFVVGVGRWTLRVEAYAFFLLTDDYPPFSLS